MNEKVKAHLIAYCESKGWGTDDDTLMEVLSEAKELYRKTTGSHRWYDDLFKVVEVNGMAIGFDDFYMTGDNSRSDMDLNYDLSSVCEVEKKQKTIDYYEPVKTEQAV